MKTQPIEQLIGQNLERIQPLVSKALSEVGQRTFVALTDPESSPKEFSDARDLFANAISRAIIEAQLELIQGPPLENYKGFVVVKIQPTRGSVVEPNSICDLVITFGPEKPPNKPGSFVGDITIEGGVDKEQVEFQLEFDKVLGEVENPFLRSSDTNPNGNIKVLVKPNETKELRFPFKTPDSIGVFEAWIQVFQGNSLIQVVPIKIKTNE